MTAGTLKPATSRLALTDERVAFTGKLASMSRREASDIVKQSGGRPSAAVTKATTLVVVGMEGWPLLADGQLSTKLQAAQSLRRRRSRLQIWSEAQFLEAVGLKEDRLPAARKSMSAAQVCDIVGMNSDTLHRWELLGLVRPCDGLYDFQDIVSLQTVATLIANGARPTTIARSVQSLAKILPGSDRPLAQLKLLAEQDDLVAEVNGCLVASSGQFLIRFDSADTELNEVEIAGSLPMPSVQRPADEWFEIASEHEDAEEWPQAIASYRAALSQRPFYPEANFNLANALSAVGRPDAAAERLRVALEQDPTMAVAWFNLADLLDEQGDLEEAIVCLRTAVRVGPQYADAHYNLAVACQKAGLRDEALEHWREYVRLDPSSEWSALARRELSA